MPKRLLHWFDYKSPYAYLAQEETFALAREAGAELELVPYTLDIPSFAGRAELDDAGRVLVDERNAHQWRRVRYAYMDSRREARRRGLVLRGPRRIYDSALAHIGFLWARHECGSPAPSSGAGWERYHALAFERFFRRELDPGDGAQVETLLAEADLPTAGFAAWAGAEGLARLEELAGEAEELGVFGVPSYGVDGELYWGAERIPHVRERLGA